MPHSLVGLLRRRAPSLAAVVVLVGVAATALGAADRGPDLLLGSVSAPSAQLAPGSTFGERITEKNIGNKRARASSTGFYLSPAAKLVRGAIHLTEAVRIRSLDPGKVTKRTVNLVIPSAIAPGSYFLIGCADARHQVKERDERNNCRVAAGRVTVKAGGAGGTTTVTTPGTPTCVPTNDPALASPDPSCFDGNAADGVFVSGIGDDSNPGTMASPKRTLAAGVSTAAAQGKDVYVTK
ncbi:MAG: CARDB domain-containing protein, partial [Solirubrobacterales bacterium]